MASQFGVNSVPIFPDLLYKRDLNGNSVLHYAVQCDHQKGRMGVKLTKKLIEKGAGTVMYACVCLVWIDTSSPQREWYHYLMKKRRLPYTFTKGGHIHRRRGEGGGGSSFCSCLQFAKTHCLLASTNLHNSCSVLLHKLKTTE